MRLVRFGNILETGRPLDQRGWTVTAFMESYVTARCGRVRAGTIFCMPVCSGSAPRAVGSSGGGSRNIHRLQRELDQTPLRARVRRDPRRRRQLRTGPVSSDRLRVPMLKATIELSIARGSEAVTTGSESCTCPSERLGRCIRAQRSRTRSLPQPRPSSSSSSGSSRTATSMPRLAPGLCIRFIVEETLAGRQEGPDPGRDRGRGCSGGGRASTRRWTRSVPDPGGAAAALARTLLPAVGSRGPGPNRAAARDVPTRRALERRSRGAPGRSARRTRGPRAVTAGPPSW